MFYQCKLKNALHLRCKIFFIVKNDYWKQRQTKLAENHGRISFSHMIHNSMYGKIIATQLLVRLVLCNKYSDYYIHICQSILKLSIVNPF